MKRLQLMLSLVAFALVTMATPRTEQQARDLALNFINTHPAASHMPATGPRASLQLAYTRQVQGEAPAFYVYNLPAAGYVLVSGSDRTAAVLGYAEAGTFDPTDIPENLQAWLDDYASLISAIERSPEGAVLTSAGATQPIAPLLGETKWNQGTPYNNMCPTYVKDGETKHAVTGCVATAMAQAMYYHKWPTKGTGSYSYSCILNKDSNQVANLSANFANSTYAWDLMTPTYGDDSSVESQDAVAKLMSDCGISVNMVYGSSSSAATRRAMCALGSYFKYDKTMRYLRRDCYTLNEWTSFINGELEANRLIIYSGTTASGGGHAFILDGRDDSGYYHINWGWSGKSNGYFLIFELTPSQQGIGGSNGGYNNAQGMIVGMKPDAGGVATYSVYASEFYTESTRVKKGYSATFQSKSMVGVCTDSPVSTTIVRKVQVYNSAGTVVATSSYSSTSTMTMKPNYSYNRQDNVTIPSSLAVGKYTVRLVYESVDGSVKDFVEVGRGPHQYVNMEVKSDGYAYFTDADYASALHVDSLSIMNQALANQQVYVRTTLSNTVGEYYGDVYFAMLNSSGAVASESASARVDVQAGCTMNREMVFTAPATPGTYTLAMLDADKAVIPGTTLSVTVGAEPAPFALSIQQALQPANATMPASCIQGSATVKNNGGVFNGTLELMILNIDNTTIVTRFYTPFLTIAGGETATLSFSSPFPNGVSGKQYRMVLRDPHDTSTNKMWGSAQVFTVGEEPTVTIKPGDVNEDGEVNVNDVTVLINYILGKNPETFNAEAANLNGDGGINVNDVTMLINLILGVQ